MCDCSLDADGSWYLCPACVDVLESAVKKLSNARKLDFNREGLEETIDEFLEAWEAIG